MAGTSPHINSQYLQEYLNRNVRVVGKVTALHGASATLDAEGPITVYLDRDAHLTLNNAAEVIGRVNQDLSIKVFRSSDWGPNIDYAAANAVVKATMRHPEVFTKSTKQT